MRKDIKFLGVIILVGIITMLPMFLSSYKSSHDTKFHLANIVSLTEQIENNFFFPSKIVSNIGNDFGYGTALFYSPLAHYPTAYLNVIINNPTISLKIVHFLGLILSGVTMYLLAKTVSKNRFLGLLSAIIYMLFPYHLSNIYIRDSLDENFLFVFLPLIFLGLYELLNNNYKKFYIYFIIGYVGGIFSHLIIMCYLTIIILILLLVNYKKFLKYLKQLLIAIFLILCLSSPFWICLLQQKLLGNYNLFVVDAMVQGTWGNGLNPFEYLAIFKNTSTGEIKYYIDLIVIILLFLTLKKYKNIKNDFYNIILLFGIISLLLSTILFPWDIFPKLFRLIQFPWRFTMFVTLCISLLAPLCLNNFKDKKIITLLLVIVLILFSQPNLKQATNEEININNLEYWYGEGGKREYTPVNTINNLDYYNNRNYDIIVLEGNGDIELINNDIPYLEFSVVGNVTVELPRLYYVGYTLIDEDNNLISIYENEKGFIETKLNDGTYRLNFTGTKYDKLASFASLISALGLILFVWRRK